MAVDKLVDSTQLNTDLTSVANAIRTKGGTNASLAFPAGFVSAIEAIPSGGGGGAGFNDVNFYDYDGTIVSSYSAADFAQLSAMPANPSHDGLTAQGWNWSLSDAKTYVTTYGKLNIGQMYVTSDGKTRLYIRLEQGRLAPYLGLAVNGTAIVDWGDNSATSTVTGSDTTTVINTQHTYAAPGDYVISIAVSGSAALLGRNAGSQVLWKNSATGNPNRCYWNAIKKIEIGTGISISAHAFQRCSSLASITIPSGVTSISDYVFQYCYSLVSITIPSGVTSIGINAFNNCSSLASVTIPSGVTSIDGGVFQNCYSRASVTIPSGVTSISSSVFQNCFSLVSITIPSGVTSIGSNAFNSCYSLGEIHFKRSSPATVDNSNAWTDLPTDCIIYVPLGSLSAYTSATNYPSSSTYTYREE